MTAARAMMTAEPSDWPSFWHRLYYKPTQRDRNDGVIPLLAKILRDTPKLPGALCVPEPELFDGETIADINAAQAICQTCPVRQQCEDYAFSEPLGSVSGVVGGHYFDIEDAAPSRTRQRVS